MPGEVGGVGAEGGLRCEGERAVVEIGEREVAAAGEDGFGDVGFGDLDAPIVVYGPKAGIEEVVGCRGRAATRSAEVSPCHPPPALLKPRRQPRTPHGVKST